MSCAAGRKLGELRLFEVGIQLRTSFGGRRRCKRLGSEEVGGLREDQDLGMRVRVGG